MNIAVFCFIWLIIFQLFFIFFLQRENEELLKLAQEQQEVNSEMNNLNKKIIKINKERIKKLKEQNEIILILENKVNFYREHYVPKCPECFKDGADMEIMPNWQCERCDYKK